MSLPESDLRRLRSLLGRPDRVVTIRPRFPQARVRGKTTSLADGLPRAGVNRAAVVSPDSDGFGDAYFLNVAAGVTSVQVSPVFSGPCFIARVDISNDLAAAQPSVAMTFKVAQDGDTGGGLGTSGESFLSTGGTGIDLILSRMPMVFEPWWLVRYSTFRLKVILVNNQAGAVSVAVAVSYRRARVG